MPVELHIKYINEIHKKKNDKATGKLVTNFIGAFLEARLQ